MAQCAVRFLLVLGVLHVLRLDFFYAPGPAPPAARAGF